MIGLRHHSASLIMLQPPCGLPASEVNELATYNAEVARGLVHTDEHRARMARLQRRFDIAEPPPGRPDEHLIGLIEKPRWGAVKHLGRHRAGTP